MGQPGRNAERGSLTRLPQKGSSKATNCVCADNNEPLAGLFGARLSHRLRWGSRGITLCRHAGRVLPGSFPALIPPPGATLRVSQPRALQPSREFANERALIKQVSGQGAHVL